MRLIMPTSLTEAAAGPTNVVNAAGKVVFLQSKVNEEKENGTERIKIYYLGEIRDLTVELLREKGYPVCDPCIVCDELNQYCSLKECYMKSCNLHP